MFTEKELKEIAAAHEAVYEAIRPNIHSHRSDGFADRRTALDAATHIVAAKIIAQAQAQIHRHRNEEPTQMKEIPSDL
jgi:hypothetical protein